MTHVINKQQAIDRQRETLEAETDRQKHIPRYKQPRINKLKWKARSRDPEADKQQYLTRSKQFEKYCK